MKKCFSFIACSVTLIIASHSAIAGQAAKIAGKATSAAAQNPAAEPPPAAPATASTPAAKKATAPPKDPIGDVASAEKAVKFQLNAVKQAKAQVEAANKNRDALHATYKGKNLDQATYAAVMKRYEAADKAIPAAEQKLATARGAFDILFDKYQKLGGTNDYRSQLP